MSQRQGSSSTTEGRLGAEIGTAAAVGAFVLGVGWGTTAALVVDPAMAGANDQCGSVQITSNGTGQAQATATVAFTFTDGAYAALPRFALVVCDSSTSALTDQIVCAATLTTTVLTWVFPILPVATKVYLFRYLVIA